MYTENDTRDHHDTPPGPARVKKDGVRQRPQCGVRRRLTRLSASLPVGTAARRHGNADLQVGTAARRAAKPRTPNPPHGTKARERRPAVGTARQRRAEGTTPPSGMAHRGPQGREPAITHSPAWRTRSPHPASPGSFPEQTSLQEVTEHKRIRFATPLPILPMTDSDRPLFRLFQKPEEPPPGLGAIRAWLRKPRPRLAHALSWIPYLLSGIPEAWKFAKKNYGPATVRLKRIAARATPAARALARFGPVAAAAARLARLVDRSVRAGQVFVTKYRAAMSGFNSLWWNPGERRGWPVLPVGARRPADKAREGGIPGVFRPKRNDERRAATRFSRDGSPAERRLGFATGC